MYTSTNTKSFKNITSLEDKLNISLPYSMLFSVEQAFVGRDEIQAPIKMLVWEAN